MDAGWGMVWMDRKCAVAEELQGSPQRQLKACQSDDVWRWHSRMGPGTWDTGIGLASGSAALDGELQAVHGKLGNVGCPCPLCMYPRVPWGQLFGLGLQDPGVTACCVDTCALCPILRGGLVDGGTLDKAPECHKHQTCPTQPATGTHRSVCHPNNQCPPAQVVLGSCDPSE